MGLTLRTSVALTALLALAACSDDGSGSDDQTQSKSKPPAPAVEQVVADVDVTPYRYDPTNKPDPFASYILSMRDVAARSAASTPLERFDLSQLSVQAIIWGLERARALIIDPSGKGYIIAVGTPIGKNEGRVIEIADNLLVVKETYVDYRGQATSKDVKLRLRRQGG